LTTDGSEESLRAVEPAALLARRTGGRITLLRIVPELTAISDTGFATPTGVLAKSSQAEIDAARAELMDALARFSDVQVDVAIEASATPAAAIVEYARKHGADLIAMASHGRTGLRRILLGSTAESVLRTSDIPVLIFPLKQG